MSDFTCVECGKLTKETYTYYSPGYNQCIPGLCCFCHDKKMGAIREKIYNNTYCRKNSDLKLEQCGACDLGKCFKHDNIYSFSPKEIRDAMHGKSYHYQLTGSPENEKLELLHNPHCRDCRRFEAACAAMQSMIGSDMYIKTANDYIMHSQIAKDLFEGIAIQAVKQADALLAELEKE